MMVRVDFAYVLSLTSVAGKGKLPWQACTERATSVPICTLCTQVARLGLAWVTLALGHF